MLNIPTDTSGGSLASALTTGALDAISGGGFKRSTQQSNQQNQSLNFNPVISIGGNVAADNPYSNIPSFNSGQTSDQSARSGLTPSYGLNSAPYEPGPSVTPQAASTASNNWGGMILIGAIAIGALMLFGNGNLLKG